MPKKDPKIEALERKVRKAKDEISYLKQCKKFNVKPVESRRECEARMKREAKALPKELRQKCLDTYREGGRSLDEMAKICGVTVSQIAGVFLLNLKRVTYTTLNTETV